MMMVRFIVVLLAARSGPGARSLRPLPGRPAMTSRPVRARRTNAPSVVRQLPLARPAHDLHVLVSGVGAALHVTQIGQLVGQQADRMMGDPGLSGHPHKPYGQVLEQMCPRLEEAVHVRQVRVLIFVKFTSSCLLS